MPSLGSATSLRSKLRLLPRTTTPSPTRAGLARSNSSTFLRWVSALAPHQNNSARFGASSLYALSFSLIPGILYFPAGFLAFGGVIPSYRRRNYFHNGVISITFNGLFGFSKECAANVPLNCQSQKRKRERERERQRERERERYLNVSIFVCFFRNFVLKNHSSHVLHTCNMFECVFERVTLRGTWNRRIFEAN